MVGNKVKGGGINLKDELRSTQDSPQATGGGGFTAHGSQEPLSKAPVVCVYP